MTLIRISVLYMKFSASIVRQISPHPIRHTNRYKQIQATELSAIHFQHRGLTWIWSLRVTSWVTCRRRLLRVFTYRDACCS